VVTPEGVVRVCPENRVEGGVLAGRATYDEPLQHTAKLRAAKRSEKQEVSSSEGLSSGTQDECSLEALSVSSDFPEYAIP